MREKNFEKCYPKQNQKIDSQKTHRTNRHKHTPNRRSRNPLHRSLFFLGVLKFWWDPKKTPGFQENPGKKNLILELKKKREREQPKKKNSIFHFFFFSFFF